MSEPVKMIWAGVLLLVFASCSSGSSSHDIAGTMTLTDSTSVFNYKGHCVGDEGYDDLTEGTQVRLKDGSNKLLATGSLADGISLDDGGCLFGFVMKDVPDSKFYSVEVSDRGEISKSASDLEHDKWQFFLTLG